MPVRDFRQIRPVDFSGAIAGTKAAADTFSSGFDNLREAMANSRANRDAGINRETEDNTRSIQSGLESLKTIDDFNQAKDQGAFEIDTLSNQFGTRFDQQGTAKMVADTQARLKGEATKSAIQNLRSQGGIESNDDIIKLAGGLDQNSVDIDAVTSAAKSMLAGSRADTVASRSDKKFREADEFDKALANLDAGLSGGVGTPEAIAEASKTLTGANKVKFQKEAKDIAVAKASATPAQQAEFAFSKQEGDAKVEALGVEAQNTIGALQTEISRMNPISEETAQHFSDVADPGGSVRDWFSERIGKHDWDIDNVNKVFRRLTASGKINAEDAAGIMVESWRANEDVYSNWLGKGIDVGGAWEKDIERRVGQYKTKRTKERQLATVSIQYQDKIAGLKTSNRKALHEQITGTQKGNTSGRSYVKKKPKEVKAPKTKAETKSEAAAALSIKYKGNRKLPIEIKTHR